MSHGDEGLKSQIKSEIGNERHVYLHKTNTKVYTCTVHYTCSRTSAYTTLALLKSKQTAVHNIQIHVHCMCSCNPLKIKST